jgi:hypothetical protein
MAKWRWHFYRKAAVHPAGSAEVVSAVSAGTTETGKAPRGPRRVRYDSRMDDPQGWRSTFMSY